MGRDLHRTLVLAAVLAVSAVAAETSAAASTPTAAVGAYSTSPGSSTSPTQPATAGRVGASRFTVGKTRVVSRISAYVGARGLRKQRTVRFGLYADEGGKPAARVGTTKPYVIRSPRAARWVTLSLAPPVALARGRYHVAIDRSTTADADAVFVGGVRIVSSRARVAAPRLLPGSRTVQPGQSWDAAFDAAAPGDVIDIAPGYHGNQLLNGAKAAPGVTFRAAPAATARSIVAAKARGLIVEGLANINVVSIFESQDVAFRNNGIGNCRSDASINCSSKVANSQTVTLEGNRFRNVTSSNLELYHVECLFIANANDGVAIERNSFFGCQVFDIFFQTYSGAANSRNLRIVNNWFDAPTTTGTGRRGTALSFSSLRLGPYRNTLIAYNSFAPDAGISADDASLAGVRFVANLYQGHNCFPNSTYARNVIVPFSPYNGKTPCSTDGKVVAGFGYASTTDFHLSAGSPAVDAGDPGFFPATDFDGQPRSSRPAAGSDQRR